MCFRFATAPAPSFYGGLPWSYHHCSDCYLAYPLDMFYKTFVFNIYVITGFRDDYDVLFMLRIFAIVYDASYPERDMCILILKTVFSYRDFSPFFK